MVTLTTSSKEAIMENQTRRCSDTLVSVQDRYIETVLSAKNRWSHRKDGGHAGRARRAAARKAHKSLLSMGFSDMQACHAIKDAHDMVILELNAE
jgi:hypothetical protein